MKRSRLHSCAVSVAVCTLLVVMSGAADTSSHRAMFHTTHVALAGTDTLLIVALAVWLSTRAGWIALSIAGADAALGWLGSSGPVSGTLHAGLGAMLFGALAVIVLITSPSWHQDPQLVQDYGWPSLRFLSAAAAFLVAVQVGFGAGFRHSAVGVMPHLLGALVVALFIIIVGAFVTHQFPKHASLRPMAVTFMTITGIQAFLGMTAFLVRMMGTPGSLVFLIVSVAHVATGSLTFAASVRLASEIRRSVQPRTESPT